MDHLLSPVRGGNKIHVPSVPKPTNWRLTFSPRVVSACVPGTWPASLRGLQAARSSMTLRESDRGRGLGTFRSLGLLGTARGLTVVQLTPDKVFERI